LAIRNAEMRIESKRLPQRADTAISRNDIRDEGIGAPQRGHISCVPLSWVSFCAGHLRNLDAIPPVHLLIALIAVFLLFVFGSVII
jgi:hypothetical protein